MKKKCLVLFLSILALMLSLSTCGGANPSADSSAGNSAAAPSEIKLTIVHTNDVHSYAEVEAFVKSYVKTLRDEGEHVVLVSAGDAFTGTPFASLSKGQNVVTVMNDVGYELMTLGNHEQSLKLEVLQPVVDNLNFPVLGNANLYGKQKEDIKGVKDYLIKTYGKVKVAFLGLTWASYTKEDVGVVGDYTVAQLEAMKAAAEQEGAQVFVAVTHIGVTDPDLTNRSTYIAEKAPWLAAIIDAHCHTAHENGLIHEGVLIAETGEYGSNIGVVELTFSPEGKLTNRNAKLIPIKGHEEECGIVPDAGLADSIAAIRAGNEAYLQTVILDVPYDLDGERETTRTGETNFGDLICDAVLWKTGAQVTITSCPFIRGSVSKGKMTNEMLLALFFDQPAVLFTRDVTGAELYEILEKSVASYPRLSPSFKQIGGMRVVVDPAQEPGSRVASLTLNDGTLIEPDGVYRFAWHDALDNWREDAVEGVDFETGYGTTPEAFVEYIKNGDALGGKTDGRIQYIEGSKS